MELGRIRLASELSDLAHAAGPGSLPLNEQVYHIGPKVQSATCSGLVI